MQDQAGKKKCDGAAIFFGTLMVIVIIAGIVFFTHMYSACEIETLAIMNQNLHERLANFQNNPTVLPDSNGKYMVIFSKEIFQPLTPKVSIGDKHLDKKQHIRVLSGVVTSGAEKGKELFSIIGVRLIVSGSDEPIQIQGDDENHFFFLLTAEQAHQGFQLQVLDSSTWLPLKLKSPNM